jgi:hypothetical protein
MKVAQSQDKKENTPESIVDFKELLLYPSPEISFEFPIKIDVKKHRIPSYVNLYSFNNINNCFHPPRA